MKNVVYPRKIFFEIKQIVKKTILFNEAKFSWTCQGICLLYGRLNFSVFSDTIWLNQPNIPVDSAKFQWA